jgi:hypothetical protein
MPQLTQLEDVLDLEEMHPALAGAKSLASGNGYGILQLMNNFCA